jgi:hypothetical protein
MHRHVAHFIVMAALSWPLAGCWANRGVDDAVITARVRTALLEDPRTSDSQIDLVTHRGVVTLPGSVSPAARDGALAIVVRTPDVRGVTSVLHVKDSREPANPTAR